MFAAAISLGQAARQALRLAVGLVVVIVVIVSGVHMESWSAPDQMPAQINVASGTHDCPTADGTSSAVHCQIVTVGSMDISSGLPPFAPSTGSIVWRQGDATSGPIRVVRQLFRPPITLRAQS